MNRVVEAFHVARGSEKAIGRIQILLVLAVVFGTIAITKILQFNADSGPGFTPNQSSLVVDVLLPDAAPFAPTRRITGVVEARAMVPLSPQVGGRVATISDNLQAGAAIKAGETLFSIDKADYELALERAEAEVAAAEADLLQTQATAENFRADWFRVFPDKPAPALVAKEPQIRALQARLKGAQAGVAQAQLDLGRTRISIDYPARIVTSNIERGKLVSAGGQYGSLYALDSLRINAGISPEDALKIGLKPGMTVSVQSEANKSVAFESVVTSVGSVLDERTRLQAVIVALPQGTPMVPGTFANVRIAGAAKDAVFQLPYSALATSDSVWVVNGSKLVAQPVDVIDMDKSHVYVQRFDALDGVVVSQVPTSFLSRPVTIRKHLNASKVAAASGDSQ